MGDFGASGYRAMKITEERYGINSFSDEAYDFREKVQNEIIENQLDYKISDKSIVERVLSKG